MASHNRISRGIIDRSRAVGSNAVASRHDQSDAGPDADGVSTFISDSACNRDPRLDPDSAYCPGLEVDTDCDSSFDSDTAFDFKTGLNSCPAYDDQSHFEFDIDAVVCTDPATQPQSDPVYVTDCITDCANDKIIPREYRGEKTIAANQSQGVYFPYGYIE